MAAPAYAHFTQCFHFSRLSPVLRLTLQGEEGCYTVDVIVVRPISKTWGLQLREMCVMCQVCPLVGTANDICFLDGFSQNAGGSPGQLTDVTLSSLGKQCLGCPWAVGVWRCLTDCHPEPVRPTLKSDADRESWISARLFFLLQWEKHPRSLKRGYTHQSSFPSFRNNFDIEHSRNQNLLSLFGRVIRITRKILGHEIILF